MALLRAASEQLLSSRTAPWIQRGLGALSRSFAAQAEPVEEDEGTYVVTDGESSDTHMQLVCSAVDCQ